MHINVPIREPFYPSADEDFSVSREVRIIKRQESETVWPPSFWEELLDEWESAPKILIAGGQAKPDAALNAVLTRITEEWNIPVLGDCISNLSGSEFIRPPRFVSR